MTKDLNLQCFPLVEYIKKPVASKGYNNLNKMIKVLNREERDEKGNVVDPLNYIKSTINLMKVGVILAFKINNKILVGYAQWAKDYDEYDVDFMIAVAIERAFSLETRAPKKIPFRIIKALPKFLKRAKSYYKDAELVEWAESFLMNNYPVHF